MEQARIHNFEAKKSTQISIISLSAGIACVIGISLAFIGGTFHWIYLNNQEYAINYFDAQSDYLGSYISGFVIAIVEIAASLYFLQKYDLGRSKRRYFVTSATLGIIASLVYVFAEIVTGVQGVRIGVLRLIAFEFAPASMDYGNAIIIGLNIFSLAILLKVLFKINPIPRKIKSSSSTLPPGPPSLFAGLWAGFITTASATLCCGPLPGAIALASGISSAYFATLINWQPFLVLVALPLLIFAITLADKRARSFCKLR